MKNTIFILLIALTGLFITNCKTTKTQKFPTDCTTLQLDIKKGVLNGVKPTATQEEVKKAFSCFTGETEEGVDFNCGGGIFFLDHDFYFYTYRDYLEVREQFPPEGMQPGIMGVPEEKVIEIFGEPQLKPDEYTYLYEMPYGTLRIEFTYGTVGEIGIHYIYINDIELCR